MYDINDYTKPNRTVKGKRNKRPPERRGSCTPTCIAARTGRPRRANLLRERNPLWESKLVKDSSLGVN